MTPWDLIRWTLTGCGVALLVAVTFAVIYAIWKDTVQ